MKTSWVRNLISMILAADKNGGIGVDNSLPWPHLSDDLKHFKQVTTDKIVVMGANTWDSLGKLAPLPGRINYVISSKDSDNFPGAVGVFDYNKVSMADIFTFITVANPDKDIMIIGGKTIYDITYEMCDTIHLTRVHDVYGCDTTVNLDEYLTNYKRLSERYVYGKEQSPALTPDISIEYWKRT